MSAKYVLLLSPLLVFIIVILIGVVLDNFVIRFLKKLAARTPTEVDDILIKALNRVIMILAFLAALYFSVNATYLASKINPTLLKSYNISLLSLTAFAIMWASSTIVNYIVDSYAQRLPHEIPTGILKTTIKVIIFTLATLIILDRAGISITPIITALGIGGLAVALALQDTLSNIFAGINLIIARHVRKGDFVKLENGEEGFVENITWRNTIIRTFTNNLIVIPNTKFASFVILNYDLMEKNRSVIISLGVSYSSDLDKVEEVTLDVAKKVQQEVIEKVGKEMLEELERRVAKARSSLILKKLKDEIAALKKEIEVAKNWTPLIRYKEFGDSSINFTVVLKAISLESAFLIRHEFIKRIKRRYDEEGIEIPFPQRDVWFRNWPGGTTV